jgi:hypothetical protein
MLIYFFSDTNYFLDGFTAEYSVTDCPLNCTDRGRCVDHACVCDSGFSGRACERETCPSDCNSLTGNGVCDKNSSRCDCKDGFSGESCSLPGDNSRTNSSWHVVSRTLFDERPLFPRTGSAGVYVSSRDAFYVFGGFDLNSVAEQFLSYDFSSGKWSEIRAQASPEAKKPPRSSSDLQFTVDNQTVSVRHKEERPRREASSDLAPFPRGRFGHAMTFVEPDLIVLHGGEFTDGSLSDELWIYNLTSETWSLVTANGVRPPPLAKHTLTNVGNGSVVVFGGSRPFGEFSSKMYRINVTSPVKIWEKVEICVILPCARR